MPDSANILILRRIKPGAETEFDQAVRLWIPAALQHPGHLGVFLLQPGPESSEHGALLRFRSMADWERFRDWPPYARFLADIRPLLLEDPRVEVLHGLEALFRPGADRPPPRWKMAVATWMGVNGMVWAVSRGFSALNPGWPGWVGFLVGNALVVAGLTWVVMPALVRVLGPWLSPRAR